MMAKLAREALDWRKRKAVQGPADRDTFVIEPDGSLWRCRIQPREGLIRVVTGLTFPEANRIRLELSDAGYLGKVVGYA
jgi:hypothetical protein